LLLRRAITKVCRPRADGRTLRDLHTMPVRLGLDSPTAPGFFVAPAVTARLRRLRRQENLNEPGGARTHDLRIKSPLLYRLSYRLATKGEGGGGKAEWLFPLPTSPFRLTQLGMRGLEPPLPKELEPKSSASASSATSPNCACVRRTVQYSRPAGRGLAGRRVELKSSSAESLESRARTVVAGSEPAMRMS
jgi:hypothetical protein